MLDLFNVTQTLKEGSLNGFRVRLSNIMAFIGFAISLFYSGLYFFNGITFLGIYFFFLLCLFLLTIILNQIKYDFAGRLLVSASSIATITSSIVNFGRGSEVQVYLAIILVLIFLLFESKKIVAVFVVTVFMAYLGSFLYLETHTPAFEQFRTPYDHFINYGYGLAGITLLSYIVIKAIYSYIQQTIESLLRVKEKNVELESKNILIEKQKNEMELFTAIASHDLKSPVRTIRSYLGLIQKKMGAPEEKEELKKYLGFINNGAKELDNIINGIGEFRKIGDYDISESYSDSNVILRRISQKIQEEVEGNMNISIAQIPKFKINGSHLEILFYALMSNGIIFNKANEKKLDVSSKVSGSNIIIEIKDNGLGVDKEYQEYIFKPFKKLNTKAFYSGAGLGLSNAQKIVEMYGGKLTIESPASGGSVFKIILPEDIIIN